MRLVNLRPAGDPSAECSLVVLGGDGGGLTANVNRWGDQMGLGPLSEEEVERMRAEAEANAESDKKQRELVDLKNQVEQIVHQTDKHLEEHGEKLEIGRAHV